ncbi:MAG TPA: class I SAM-dependent methyltransferase [Microthrixaceae bacterium]|jgi:demethylmenaquinone methyltransferase/2-methoxy-6-polyprenyl-1,4-benzoquinol methylase|nr:class I SAM-dependent methyltransferase [Microthrixaceae bacterium]
MSRSEDLLSEQLLYYRHGAAQYDAANRSLLNADDADGRSRREGRAHATEALAVAKDRSVLEIAGGTGVYTEMLAQIAGDLTVVDASPESLDINRQATAGAPVAVRYIESDIFDWTPTDHYEVVAFAFWLSHVPTDAFERFWSLVDRCLTKDGTVVIIDAGEPAHAASQEDNVNFFSEDRVDESTSVRYLQDGTAYRIVRVLWNREQLADELARLGWTVEFAPAEWLIGHVHRTA